MFSNALGMEAVMGEWEQETQRGGGKATALCAAIMGPKTLCRSDCYLTSSLPRVFEEEVFN